MIINYYQLFNKKKVFSFCLFFVFTPHFERLTSTRVSRYNRDMEHSGMTRQKLLRFVAEQYGTSPDYVFDDPDLAVLRHPCGKWYGIAMHVPASTFGFEGGSVDAVNVKCSPEIAELIRYTPGIAPAYHMNKRHWLSVILDGSLGDDKVKFLVDNSYCAVTPRAKRRKEVKR